MAWINHIGIRHKKCHTAIPGVTAIFGNNTLLNKEHELVEMPQKLKGELPFRNVPCKAHQYIFSLS